MLGLPLLALGLLAATASRLLAVSNGVDLDPLVWWVRGCIYCEPVRTARLFAFISYYMVFSGVLFASIGLSSAATALGALGLSMPLIVWGLMSTHTFTLDYMQEAILATPSLLLFFAIVIAVNMYTGLPILFYILHRHVILELGIVDPNTGSIVVEGAGSSLVIDPGSALLGLAALLALVSTVVEYATLRIVSRRVAVEEKVTEASEDTGKHVVRRGVSPECREVKLSLFVKYPEVIVEKCLQGREVHGYVIEEYIGKGGFGIVVRAHAREDPSDKSAVKLLLPMPLESSGATPSKVVRSVVDIAKDIEREASSLRELSARSPYVARLKAIHIDSERLHKAVMNDSLEVYMLSPPAIIMEYLGGGSLADFLREAMRSRLLDPNSVEWIRSAAAMGAVIAKALAHVHGSGYVYEDMKPTNILFTAKPPLEPKKLLEEMLKALLTPEEARVVPKLTDLGAAVRLETPVVQLTPGYAAPEVEGYDIVCNEMGRKSAPICSEPPRAEPSHDVYGLGMIMLQLLTGMNQKQIVRLKHSKLCKLSHEKGMICDTSKIASIIRVKGPANIVVSLIERMLSDNPEERPTASQVAACLACIAENDAVAWPKKCSSLCVIR
jgi:serine/threonine protein kinase